MSRFRQPQVQAKRTPVKRKPTTEDPPKVNPETANKIRRHFPQES